MNLRKHLPTALWAAVMAILGAATLAASLAVAGSTGLIVAADCLAVLALLVIVTRTPPGARPGQAHRPGHSLGTMLARAVRWRPVLPGWLPWWRALASGGGQQGVRGADFPSYLKISSDLSWAPVSAWHYHHGIRPLLVRLLQMVLSERYRLDPAAEPERARRLVGEDLWPLIDPGQPPSYDSSAPGTGLRALTRVVDRLEDLSPQPWEQ